MSDVTIPADLAALAALANAATTGTWHALGHEVYTEWDDGKGMKVAGYLDEADAAFIAAARDAVPALIAEVERLRAALVQADHLLALGDRSTVERDAARAAIERVRALHYRMFDTDRLCSECNDGWPCATIRALDGES